MATYKGAQVTNNSANPRVIGNSNDGLKVVQDYVNVSSSVATADILELIEVPANAIPLAIKIRNTDLGTSVPAEIGLQYGNGCNVARGTVIDADEFDTAYAFGTASLTGVDIRYDTKGLETMGQTFWELGGLSADPGGTLLIVATVGTVDTGTTGKIVVDVEYV